MSLQSQPVRHPEMQNRDCKLSLPLSEPNELPTTRLSRGSAPGPLGSIRQAGISGDLRSARGSDEQVRSMLLNQALEPRPGTAQIYESWRASHRTYHRLVLQRRIFAASGAALMCASFTWMGCLLLQSF